MKLPFTLVSILLFSACATGPDPINNAIHSIAPRTLAGEWTVERIEDSLVEDVGTIYLGFETDGTLSGDTGVNRLLGSWSLEADSLTFRDLSTTRKVGPPHRMKLEAQLIDTLRRVTRAVQRGEGNIELFSADSTLLLIASPRS